ncbi:MAG: hypothetical protein P8N09_07375 [Planctomycetota bacterium]|nr:hypothetical protein [Planctomycetota bacterium]
MTFSMPSFSFSAGRLGLAVLLACSALSAQSLTPSGPAFKASAPTRQFLSPEQADILSHLSVVYLDDGQGGMVKTIRIDGANLQVVNGQGTSDTTNGLGNLIVGYNELGNPNGDDRTGSHNLVTGQANSFTSHGGLVAGRGNSVSGPWSSVSGGRESTASDPHSSVSGGAGNTASGNFSSISGGDNNTAGGTWSSVSGGRSRSALNVDNWAAGSLFENN